MPDGPDVPDGSSVVDPALTVETTVPPHTTPQPATPQPAAPAVPAPQPATPQQAPPQPATPSTITTVGAGTRPDNGHAPPARRAARETSVPTAPIGVLRCADGPTVLLDRSYAIGRDPQNDPSVRAGLATPITVNDPTNLISRVHAFVSVHDGVVLVRDGSSASGTYLAEPGAEGWTRVTTRPTEVPPNWHLRIGTKIFIFEPTLP